MVSTLWLYFSSVIRSSELPPASACARWNEGSPWRFSAWSFISSSLRNCATLLEQKPSVISFPAKVFVYRSNFRRALAFSLEALPELLILWSLSFVVGDFVPEPMLTISTPKVCTLRILSLELLESWLRLPALLYLPECLLLEFFEAFDCLDRPEP